MSNLMSVGFTTNRYCMLFPTKKTSDAQMIKLPKMTIWFRARGCRLSAGYKLTICISVKHTLILEV